HVHRDPCLVVGRATAEEALAADDGLERRTVPVGRVVLRLDIMVRVKQDDRSPLRSLPLADHGRRGTTLGPDDFGPDPLSGQELCCLPRGLLHLSQALRVSTDGLDPDESLKVAYQAGQEIVDTVLQVAHAGNSTIPRPGAKRRRRARPKLIAEEKEEVPRLRKDGAVAAFRPGLRQQGRRAGPQVRASCVSGRTGELPDRSQRAGRYRCRTSPPHVARSTPRSASSRCTQCCSTPAPSTRYADDASRSPTPPGWSSQSQGHKQQSPNEGAVAPGSAATA